MKLDRYKGLYCYGKLVHGEASLSFRVPATSKPIDDEEVIIEGALRAARNSLEIQLIGDVQGAWRPLNRKSRVDIPDRERPPQTLLQFLQHNDPDRLGYVSTETALRDMERAAGPSVIVSSPREQSAFADEGQLVAAVERLLRKPIKGIVVARGGGVNLDEVGNSAMVAKALIESGIPFYTALGHANDRLLLDKYADESFGTPSDFGHRLSSAIKFLADHDDIRKQADRWEAEAVMRAEDLRKARLHEQQLNQQVAAAGAERDRRDFWIKVLGFAVLVLVAIVVSLLSRH
jgi:exodeoxyribonuclease VII large subunit